MGKGAISEKAVGAMRTIGMILERILTYSKSGYGQRINVCWLQLPTIISSTLVVFFDQTPCLR